MASEIIDIIHELSYQVKTEGLDKALQSVQAQVKTIGKLYSWLNALVFE